MSAFAFALESRKLIDRTERQSGKVLLVLGLFEAVTKSLNL